MPQLPNQFDATQQKEMDTYEPLPEGDYVVAISSSELKDAKTAGNSYIQLDMDVLQGEHQGETYICRLNLFNTSQKAVDMANRELGAICKACGKPLVTSTEELHNIPMIVTLKVTPGKGDYGPSNQATGYSPAGQQQPQPVPQQQPQPVPQQQPQPVPQQPVPQAPASQPQATPQAETAPATSEDTPPWG